MEDADDKVPMQPPEPDYISERRVIKIPVTNRNLKDRWQLRLYAEKQIERETGDSVQLTSLKVRQPSLMARTLARLFRKTPNAKLYITIKF